MTTKDHQFSLHIRLGNDGMRTREDVADVLHLACTLVLIGSDTASIRDVNGNTVGRWTYDDGEEMDD